MKTIFRFAALALLLALGLEDRAAAQAAAQDAPPASGKILILINDRVMEGEIERVGDQYRIRRGMGETLIAARRGKRLCADWGEALAYVRSQANLGDPDERLRVARWCQQNDLIDDALTEARAALDMRPTHPETKQLVQILQRSSTNAPAAQPAVAHEPKVFEAVTPLDISADSLALFTTKVQPILLNACASCHSNGQGGGFQLVRSGDLAPRLATQRNLTMAVRQLRLDNPAVSPLLVKAVSAHGTLTQPLFRDRRAVPVQTLQRWAEQLAANNPHLRETRGGPPVAQAAPEQAVAPAPATVTANPPVVTPVVSRPVTRADVKDGANVFGNAQTALSAGQSPLPPMPPVARGTTSAATSPNDAYDPAVFNSREGRVPR
ncbi:MAG: hypothetical protein L0Y71_13695 [Gemmataceae bacterium]|nr:hypothetical protein [Gemmataceae bacterium]